MMRAPTVNLSFPKQYLAAIEHDLPGKPERVQYFNREDAIGGRDGLIVRVVPPSGDQWTGVFAFGKLSKEGHTGLYSCPNDLQLCVVSLGDGYLVRADDPSSFEIVKACPVVSVYPIFTRGLLVFADPWQLVAYRSDGIAWSTGRIAIEGLVVTEITSKHILGKADRFQSGGKGAGFVVDLATGVVT